MGRALELDEQDPDALRALARHSERAGRYTEGRAALFRLVKSTTDPRVKFSIWLEIANLDELRRKDAEGAVLALQNAALMKALGHAGQHPEGRFLPETYAWVRGDSDLDILKRAHAAMAKALDAAWAARAGDVPLKDKDEALVLASIVEKETGIAEERPAIAGVFARRLKIGMRLQTDPTVIYGMGAAYAGNIRRSDLATDTPYNTYTRAGLPPTPIAMPGAAALKAATRPAAGDALFFVAVGDGSGRHVFTASLAEHNAAVREYLQRYRTQQQSAPK